MDSSQNNAQSSFVSSISNSVLTTFQNSFQSKLRSLQSFQAELQDKKEVTVEKFEAQKQNLQTLIVEIAGFLDDLLLPIVEQNPFYLEDFLIFIDDFINQVETQFSLFRILSVSSLRNEVRKQISKTSQNFETKALKDSFEEKQKQTLLQTEILLEKLNQQLINIRHRIEKQKDMVLNSSSLSVSSLTSLTLPSLKSLNFPSISTLELTNLSEKTISNFELVKQDIKRFFM